MNEKESVDTLLEQGLSNRKIAKLLGIDKKTVNRAKKQLQKGPNPPTGNNQNGPNPPTGPASSCEPYRRLIEEKLSKGRPLTGIHYDLIYEHGATVSYDAVKRFARRLTDVPPELVTRLEFPLGEAAQVDFGQGAPTLHPKTGKRRRPHLFVMTLCASRKAYYEVVWRQDARTFIECHKRAFAFLGGVPRAIILDNLKAAIVKACWEEPEVSRYFSLFARHTGFAVLPCHPASPTEKGIVESGVKYAQGALKGRTFESLGEQNTFLQEWEARVASKRIHGTTKRQVDAMFTEERPLLQPEPADPFEIITLETRRVFVDGTIEVAGAYYPVPEAYIGQSVEVRMHEKMLRIFVGNEQVVAHPFVPRGTRAPRTFARAKEVPASRSEFELQRIAWATAVGEEALSLVRGALEARPMEAHRFLMGLPRLREKYGAEVFGAAAREAAELQVFRSRPLRLICERIFAEQSLHIELTQEHELIRSMQEYSLLTLQNHERTQ
jgi:transposase